MLSKEKEEALLKDIQKEVNNNPNQVYYGLYKDYSDYKGIIYGQKDNIYTIITSSHTYVTHLEAMGYHKVFIYKCSLFRDGKIMKL